MHSEINETLRSIDQDLSYFEEEKVQRHTVNIQSSAKIRNIAKSYLGFAKRSKRKAVKTAIGDKQS